MPRGTLSANRAIFSEKKIARFLLVGENPKSPVTHCWCGCAFCGCFFLRSSFLRLFPFDYFRPNAQNQIDIGLFFHFIPYLTTLVYAAFFAENAQ